MKFYNSQRPVATMFFYVGVLALIVTSVMTVKNFMYAFNLSSETEVYIGKLPGRVLVNKYVPQGDYVIDVKWNNAMQWGDDAITDISEGRRYMDGSRDIIIKSSRPDKHIPGGYELASTGILVESTHSISLSPAEFRDGKLILVNSISWEWIFFRLLVGFFIWLFVYLVYTEFMKKEKERKYYGR